MNIKKLKKMKDITMMLCDLRKVAPPAYQDAISTVIRCLTELMLEEVDK